MKAETKGKAQNAQASASDLAPSRPVYVKKVLPLVAQRQNFLSEYMLAGGWLVGTIQASFCLPHHTCLWMIDEVA